MSFGDYRPLSKTAQNLLQNQGVFIFLLSMTIGGDFTLVTVLHYPGLFIRKMEGEKAVCAELVEP